MRALDKMSVADGAHAYQRVERKSCAREMEGDHFLPAWLTSPQVASDRPLTSSPFCKNALKGLMLYGLPSLGPQLSQSSHPKSTPHDVRDSENNSAEKLHVRLLVQLIATPRCACSSHRGRLYFGSSGHHSGIIVARDSLHCCARTIISR